jgi:ATPase family AAA domain-containing protein 1
VYYLIRFGLSKYDIENEDARRRKAAAAAVMQRIDKREKQRNTDENGYTTYGADGEPLRQPRKEDLVLNQYEQTIASEVVAPDDIAVRFDGML